jgi:hypothetical protein
MTDTLGWLPLPVRIELLNRKISAEQPWRMAKQSHETKSPRLLAAGPSIEPSTRPKPTPAPSLVRAPAASPDSFTSQFVLDCLIDLTERLGELEQIVVALADGSLGGTR